MAQIKQINAASLCQDMQQEIQLQAFACSKPLHEASS